MAAIFTKVAPLIIAAEGGESKSPTDYGGETKYGISEEQYPDEDIKNLTPERALAILEADYWEPYHLSDILDQTVANQCFFLFVNMNPEKATKIIQTAVNGVGRAIIFVKVDGVMGPVTIQAVNSLAPYWLSDRLRVESCRYYLKRVDQDRSQEANFIGWIRRVVGDRV
jgi:lysozyme family protein